MDSGLGGGVDPDGATVCSLKPSRVRRYKVVANQKSRSSDQPCAWTTDLFVCRFALRIPIKSMRLWARCRPTRVCGRGGGLRREDRVARTTCRGSPPAGRIPVVSRNVQSGRFQLNLVLPRSAWSAAVHKIRVRSRPGSRLQRMPKPIMPQGILGVDPAAGWFEDRRAPVFCSAPWASDLSGG